MADTNTLTNLYFLLKSFEEILEWHNGYITLRCLELEITLFRILSSPFSILTRNEWTEVARIVWMYIMSARDHEHRVLTSSILEDVGLRHTDPDHPAVLPEIKDRFYDAPEPFHPAHSTSDEDVFPSIESGSSPIFDPEEIAASMMSPEWSDESESRRHANAEHEEEGTGTGTGQEEADQQELEVQKEGDDDDTDHVIAMDGMRRIKDECLALALRSTDARRGANDDELQRLDLALECPYMCKQNGIAGIAFTRAKNVNAHMRRVHGCPDGFRVVAVDVDSRQYKMAGSGTEEVVLWKLVPEP